MHEYIDTKLYFIRGLQILDEMEFFNFFYCDINFSKFDVST